jgi:hypothetical protein
MLRSAFMPDDAISENNDAEPLSTGPAPIHPRDLSPADVIRELKAAGFDHFPEVALRAAQGMQEEITPLLIDCLREAVRNQRNNSSSDPENNAHYFALMLLWEFRAKEALPVLVESLQLSDEGATTLYGESIFEDIPRALAALAHDRPEVIEELLLDRSLPHDVRDAATTASVLLLRDGVYPRERAIEVYLRGLKEASEARHIPSATVMVAALSDAGPESVMEPIEEAYRKGLVDEWWIGLKDVQLSVKQHREGVYHEHHRHDPTFVEDIVQELAPYYAEREAEADSESDAWDDDEMPSDEEFDEALDADIDFEDDLPSRSTPQVTSARIARNDPCPCGSGKKYKKCCGAAK